MFEESKEFSIYKIFGLTEQELARIQTLAERDGVEIEYEQDGLDGRLILSNCSLSSVEFEQVVAQVLAVADGKVYADSDTTLEECVVKTAIEKGVRIGVAESLTGGMICSRIVNVSGASSVLQEGLVTYTEASKLRRLHVRSATLDSYGVVSEQVAKEMVQGLLSDKETTVGISTTGCAGPQSDAYNTPVGLVYIGIGDRNKIVAHAQMFQGSRNTIRTCTTDYALYTVLQYLKTL